MYSRSEGVEWVGERERERESRCTHVGVVGHLKSGYSMLEGNMLFETETGNSSWGKKHVSLGQGQGGSGAPVS